MEYTLYSFVAKLKEWFIESAMFPYYEISKESISDYGKSRQQSDVDKHPDRNPTHLKDVAKQCLETTTVITENSAEFNLGNYVMESKYPYYHILEDSQVIRKRGYGTKKTKGSQESERILANRDYNKVSWNGKTFTKEYSRNVRGTRNRINNVSHYGLVDLQGKYLNRDANAYWNTHYKYIEDILDNDVVIKLSTYFGLKPARKTDTGLGEEYGSQEESQYTTNNFNIIDIFNSHNIGD